MQNELNQEQIDAMVRAARSGGQADVSVPRVALVTMHVAAHYPEQCPMCLQGIPVVKPGSRPV